MKKLLAIGVVLALMGCAEKAPLTPEQQWQGYCKSVGNAARTILFDRQNGIPVEKAKEHAEKIEDETTKKFIFEIIERVYAMPEQEIKDDVEGSRELIRAEFNQKCVDTPFEHLPEYKAF